jgi:hypothetical protein
MLKYAKKLHLTCSIKYMTAEYEKNIVNRTKLVILLTYTFVSSLNRCVSPLDIQENSYIIRGKILPKGGCLL